MLAWQAHCRMVVTGTSRSGPEMSEPDQHAREDPVLATDLEPVLEFK